MKYLELDEQTFLIKITDNDMHPYLQQGDLVRVEKPGNDLFLLGDIIVFKEPHFKKHLVHRVISSGFKGNAKAELAPPFDFELVGLATHRVIFCEDDKVKIIPLRYRLFQFLFAKVSGLSLKFKVAQIVLMAMGVCVRAFENMKTKKVSMKLTLLS